MSDLETRQLALETDALEEAKKRLRKASGHTPMRLLRGYVDPLARSISEAQEAVEKGVNWPYAVPLAAIDGEKLALITLGVVLKCLSNLDTSLYGPPVIGVLREIAQWCWYENVCDKLRNRERNLALLLARRNKNPWHARRRAADMIAEFRGERWADTDTGLQLGGALLDMAIESTGLITKQLRPKKSATIQLTDEGKRKIKHLQEVDALLLAPLNLPMLVRPRPWMSGRCGGYLRHDLDFVKRQDGLPDPPPHGDMEIASEAINALQETPWRVNRRLLGVMKNAWSAGEPKVVLPLAMPDDPGRDSRNARREREIVAERDAMERRLALAARFVNEKEIYFPHNVDWRGRAYSIPQVVHPQGDDAGRALLEFARAKPLGKSGARWLAVHLANFYGHGIDKLPFDERVNWVKEHRDEIVDSATTPLDGARLWTKAKKPWRFLAAAMEYAGYVAEGPGFLSRQPIAMDGTCNGLQHFSALGRDEVGAVWTNLVPNAAPRDIYREVADRLAPRVEAAANGHAKDLHASPWVGIIDRDVVKPATMTTPYGVTREGLRDQLRAIIRDEYKDRFLAPWKSAVWLSNLIKETIAGVVVKAVSIMDWLRATATTLGRKRRGLTWTVPTGFRVTNEYRKTEEHRVQTALLTLQTLRHKTGAKIDIIEQVNGMVANLVQSLDAAHMMLTACALKAGGLADFAMVHDSYAVHACDVDLLNEVLREQFVRVHTEFTLAGLYDALKRQAPEIELPPPPSSGTLDLANVRKSEYFFS